MNREDIIRMAREARLAEPYHPMNPWSASQEALERFAALVAAHEREECAKIVATAVALREPASTYVSKILELRNETSKAD